MSVSRFTRFWLSAPIAVCIALLGGVVYTQDVQPVNSGANPYKVIRDWGKLPDRPWGGSNGVAIDRDGKIGLGGRSMLAGHHAGLSGHQGKPRSQVR